MPPLPHRDRRRDRHPGRRGGRLAGTLRGEPPRGIPPPPLPPPSAPPPPLPPPPRLACHCCRCRCSPYRQRQRQRTGVRRRSIAADRRAASWASWATLALACAAPCFLPHTPPHLLHPPSPATPPQLLQALTPCHPLTPLRPLNRCVETVAAQPAYNFTGVAPPASLVNMVQARASRVRGVCAAAHALHLSTCMYAGHMLATRPPYTQPKLSQARRTALGAMLGERSDEANASFACEAGLSPRISSSRPAPARPAPALAAPYGVRAAPRRGPPPTQAVAAEKPSPRLTGWEAAPAEAPSTLAVLEQPGRSRPGSVLAGAPGSHLVAGSRHSVCLNFVH